MRVSYSSFPGQLNRDLAPLYFLFGDEILLVEESLDQLRQAARNQGFDERLQYTFEQGFDWNQVLAGGQSMSLFAQKKIIELRIPTGKPGDAGAKALTEYANTPPSDDTILIIIAGPIERRAQNNKWFKAVEAAAITLECPTISTDKLPDWIHHRLQSKHLKADHDAVNRLAHYVEGNLLAAAQEINLLALLAKDNTITTQLIEDTIADHARFNIFSFIDTCLSGNPERLVRILQSLKQEQSEPILILWSLTREARTLCKLAAIKHQGGNISPHFQRNGVWGPRVSLISNALNRISLPQCQILLRRLARADLQLKGRAQLQRKDIWEEIESIGLALSGVKVV